MSQHKFAQDCEAKVLMAGKTRTIIFIGSAVPENIKAVLPDDADAGVSFVCRFLTLDNQERDDFKTFLQSHGFE